MQAVLGASVPLWLFARKLPSQVERKSGHNADFDGCMISALTSSHDMEKGDLAHKAAFGVLRTGLINALRLLARSNC